MIGILRKLQVSHAQPINYTLTFGDNAVALNPYIGKNISFRHTGKIHCIACGNRTKKSYSQGHCYTCMRTLACCDMCILKPETCHHANGTCREPEWGQQFCMSPHFVYLANTSGAKVGITRHTQIPTRWIDQGATQALPILKVQSRLLSGLVEVILGKHIADKTNWRAMLKGGSAPLDLREIKHHLLELEKDNLAQLQEQYGDQAITFIDDIETTLDYPVITYPEKISSHNLDKNPILEGTLLGIKGQYLILDSAVINIRKYSGYEIEWIE
ncbi:DUF2797 domain-containing protein [Thaumasiovibrio sp. DFM-14]|uniref:DUF2797 domain-containing protein n=1 Tax=Thaumasiovibrio sp. DFM-14 TaxID=3384792 RepID=UPI0039A36374